MFISLSREKGKLPKEQTNARDLFKKINGCHLISIHLLLYFTQFLVFFHQHKATLSTHLRTGVRINAENLYYI
jgi:hypothetical protein